MEGYVYFDSVRKKSKRSFRNSGGVGVFVKRSLVANGFVENLKSSFDDSVVLYIKSGIFDLMQDMILYITYISPEGSTIYDKKEIKNGITALENNIAYYRQKYPFCYLYIAGDLNARTKDLCDFIIDDTLDYVFNTTVDYDTDNVFAPRCNKDSERSNTFGKSLVELCCVNNVHILNGRLHNDKSGSSVYMGVSTHFYIYMR